jgi:hypothetical protein
MSREAPDYRDAELVIRLYELRREPVMRASRETMMAKFLPKDWDEFIAVTKPDHPMNAAFRQVGTYFEMVYGMAHHGICHPEYLAENNGEGILLFSKVAPYLERYRKEVVSTAFQHAEWIVKNTEVGKHRFELFTKRIQAQLAAKKG